MGDILEFPKGNTTMGQAQSQDFVQPAEGHPPMEFRVVSERAHIHHVFSTLDNSPWWQWRASYKTREEAEDYARQCSPDHNSIIVDLDKNEVRINGLAGRVTPKQAEMLTVLVERLGRPVRNEYLVDRVWNDGEWHDIRPYIFKLRQVLALTPFEIVGHVAKGYALVERKPIKEVLR